MGAFTRVPQKRKRTQAILGEILLFKTVIFLIYLLGIG